MFLFHAFIVNLSGIVVHELQGLSHVGSKTWLNTVILDIPPLHEGNRSHVIESFLTGISLSDMDHRKRKLPCHITIEAEIADKIFSSTISEMPHNK